MMRQKFDDYDSRVPFLGLERKLPLPAYDCVMKCSHAFNLLDARGALSAAERANYILRASAPSPRRAARPIWPRSPESTRMPIRKGGSAVMADAKDFLFEIGTEEMPSAPLNNAVKQLGTMIASGPDEAGLAHGEVRVIPSPRRLAALVADVATATDEVHEVKRGPAANIAFDADGNATGGRSGLRPQVRCGCRGSGPSRGYRRPRVRLCREEHSFRPPPRF